MGVAPRRASASPSDAGTPNAAHADVHRVVYLLVKPLLPAVLRAAHLIDAARAHLDGGDLTGGGRALADAHSVAPGEIHCRPAVRTLVAEIAQCAPAAAGVARLADLIGLSRA
ncbi:hypothetical protein ACIA3K_29785 [Micromonospora sp. NPDC051543]|uniref:hypothetical protein n=1 Tax=Micromonospora sp. NPDC051543 TaxID=3364287 RepID=UPI0037A37E11